MIFAPYRGGVGVVADFYIGASPYAKLFAPFRGARGNCNTKAERLQYENIAITQ